MRNEYRRWMMALKQAYGGRRSWRGMCRLLKKNGVKTSYPRILRLNREGGDWTFAEVVGLLEIWGLKLVVVDESSLQPAQEQIPGLGVETAEGLACRNLFVHEMMVEVEQVVRAHLMAREMQRKAVKG